MGSCGRYTVHKEALQKQTFENYKFGKIIVQKGIERWANEQVVQSIETTYHTFLIRLCSGEIEEKGQ